MPKREREREGKIVMKSRDRGSMVVWDFGL